MSEGVFKEDEKGTVRKERQSSNIPFLKVAFTNGLHQPAMAHIITAVG